MLFTATTPLFVHLACLIKNLGRKGYVAGGGGRHGVLLIRGFLEPEGSKDTPLSMVRELAVLIRVLSKYRECEYRDADPDVIHYSLPTPEEDPIYISCLGQ